MHLSPLSDIYTRSKLRLRLHSDSASPKPG